MAAPSIAIRWLHDAYIEDAFDKVENHFTKCKKIDSAALFLLNVIISEHFEFYKKLDLKLKILKVTPKLEILKSKNDERLYQTIICCPVAYWRWPHLTIQRCG